MARLYRVISEECLSVGLHVVEIDSLIRDALCIESLQLIYRLRCTEELKTYFDYTETSNGN